MHGQVVSLDVTAPIWERCFTVAPLVLVGTREKDGSYDLAPKHMATPMGWQNYFGFVCTPRHRTYHNVRRERGGIPKRIMRQLPQPVLRIQVATPVV
jgi:hypothetical protein